MAAGPEVGGGGSIRVDTAEMLQAAGVLADAGAVLAGIAVQARAAGSLAAPARRAPILHAGDLLARAQREVEQAADGLRVAAQRYGQAEQTAADLLRIGAAFDGAVRGAVVRLTLGPLGLPVLLAQDVQRLAGVVVVRAAWQALTTGRVEPQLDPVVLRALALGLSSMDDEVRGFLLLERTQHLLTEDPAAPFGTEAVAAVLAGLLLRPAGAPLAVTAGPERAVRRPRTLAQLVDRLPLGKQPAGQVRIERYADAGGTRWIVYSAGTVTFSPDSGEEPFDLASNLLGVGDRPSDSQRAVLQAMQQAGVGEDEPVLFVGHSQGALNAVRLAEDAGYRTAGVVQLGGPTGQIALPESVPVLAVEHDQDLVPVLGGVAASGSAGLSRVLVRRSLPDGGHGPGLGTFFPAHATEQYRETVRQSEASGAPQIARFREQTAGFFSGSDGTSTRYRALRVVEPPPPPPPPAPLPASPAAPAPLPTLFPTPPAASAAAR